MTKDYIEKRDGGFWIVGKRVALDTIVYAYMSGYSVESIREALPVLALEEVHGLSHSISRICLRLRPPS